MLIPTSKVLLLASVDAITDIGIGVVVSCSTLVETSSGSMVVIGATIGAWVNSVGSEVVTDDSNVVTIPSTDDTVVADPSTDDPSLIT